MPKKAKELTGLAVTKLKTEGSYAVGGVDGLYLRVRGQSRSWILCIAMGVSPVHGYSVLQWESE